MFAVLILLLLAPSVGPLNDLMEVYATPVRSRGSLMTCDMRSDTCSDGRRITTVRATPVPCETSPGVWEMVPEDTGCYSVRGLESWAANTSYLSWGAELDRSPWVVMNGSGITKLQGGGYRICHITETAYNSGINQSYSAGLIEDNWVTVSVISRPNTASMMLLGPTTNRYNSNLAMTGQDWDIYSYSTRYIGDIERVHIYPRPGGQQLCIDVFAAWLTKTDTSGRACWGGEAPVTCDADRHTISTEGWPTEAGEISITWELAEACPPGTSCFVFDGRLSGADTTNPFHIWINSSGNVTTSFYGVVFASIGQQPAPGVPTTVSARRRDGELEIYRDGTLVTAKAAGPFVWNSEANLGRRFVDATFRPLNGSIRFLRIRNYEEVSP